jgi:tetratricopeptide (TPR) repeat protein
MTPDNCLVSTIPDRISHGMTKQRAGDHKGAERIYLQVLAEDPANADAHNLLGLIALHQGKPTKAAQLINKSIVLNPGFADSHFNLGEVRRIEGKTEAAISSYRNAIALNPNHATAWTNLGVCLLQQGNENEAAQHFERALEIDQKHTPALNNLANLYRKTDRLNEAEKLLLNALAISPYMAEAHDNLGLLYQQLNDFQKATICHRVAVAIRPNYPEALTNLCLALFTLEEFKESVAIGRKAIELAPDNVSALNNLGIALLETRELEESAAHLSKALEIQPDFPECLCNLGNTMHRLGRINEALDCYKRAIKLKPDYTKAHYNQGITLEDHGDLEQAKESYRAAIRSCPDYGDAHRQLSALVKHTNRDEEVMAMEKLFAEPALDTERRMHLGFGLGKAYKDLGEYDKSFDFILEGNRLKRSMLNYSHDNNTNYFARIKEIFTPEILSSAGDFPATVPEPIFIIGMPRSGTSLTEQILASHPEVHGAGELTFFNDHSDALHQHPLTDPERIFQKLEQFEPAKLRGEYIDSIPRDGHHTRIIDKFPQNFLHLGLIHLTFPEAKIIHIQRNPMDNCLSIFRTYFVSGHYYSYNLEELGAYYKLYQDLMEHWRAVLPDRVMELQYEDLVNKQEETTRQLLEYCDLEWDAACLSFHKTRRRVGTASNAQVRKPMYKDSLELWKRYEKPLQPLYNAIYG